MQMVLGHAMSENSSLKFADVYQSLGREFSSIDPDVVSTIVPGSHIWSDELKRPLLGRELLAMQMVPEEVLLRANAFGVSDKLMSDLAGNSFTGSVFAAVAIGAIAHAATKPAQAEDEAAKVADSVDSILDL